MDAPYLHHPQLLPFLNMSRLPAKGILPPIILSLGAPPYSDSTSTPTTPTTMNGGKRTHVQHWAAMGEKLLAISYLSVRERA